MRARLGLALVVLGLSGLAAEALPVSSPVGAETAVHLVRQGCGPRGYRGPDGYCRGSFLPPPAFVDRRRFGPRRFRGPRPTYRY